MSKSMRLREQETRAVFRLLSDLREMRHDRPAMAAHLAQSLAKMIDATCGFAAEFNGWRPGGTPHLRTMVTTRDGAEVVAEAMRMLAANNNLWDDPTIEHGIRDAGTIGAKPFHQLLTKTELAENYPVFSAMADALKHIDHMIGWHTLGSTPGDIFGVSLHRYGKGQKLYNGREIALTRLLFEELHWLSSTGRLDPPKSALAAAELPPRLKQVLDALLAGKAPKQIAAELGLTTLTVRDHIRRLYRKLDVSGRDELAAKFLHRN